jgi:hypothetical protein
VKHEHTKHIGVDASYTRSQVHDQVWLSTMCLLKFSQRFFPKSIDQGTT